MAIPIEETPNPQGSATATATATPEAPTPDQHPQDTGKGKSKGTKTVDGKVMLIRVDLIEPDPDQPRKTFNQAKHEELVNSMGSMGQRTPIEIRPHPEKPRRYMIIAGERRWRAATELQWERMKAIVYKDISVEEAAKSQLLENIVRHDLDPVEEAQAMQRMIDNGFTVKELSDAIGRPLQQVKWRLQMLEASDAVLELVKRGELAPSIGHSISQLPQEHQAVALKTVTSKRMNYNEVIAFCEHIMADDSQAPLLSVDQIPQEHRDAAKIFDDMFTQVCSRLAKCDELEQQSPGSLAVALAYNNEKCEAQLDEAIKGLNRIRRQLQEHRAKQIAGTVE